MKLIQRLLLACALLMSATLPALAGETDPLFINLTTDEPARAGMGLTFGLHQHENGHPLTVFLSDKGVLLGARTHASQYAAQQEMLVALMKKGAVVLVCPSCLQHHGVAEVDLLPGLQLSNRQLSGDALFRGNTRALSW
ncbi:MAG: DsrE family protein [Pseudomonadota bacterium]|nr:DsrE family protein [Pseudomonadota bacterium]